MNAPAARERAWKGWVGYSDSQTFVMSSVYRSAPFFHSLALEAMVCLGRGGRVSSAAWLVSAEWVLACVNWAVAACTIIQKGIFFLCLALVRVCPHGVSPLAGRSKDDGKKKGR